MAFDFKKEWKEFYLPPRKPEIVTVPPMRYVAVRGRGDPNRAGGAFQRAVSVLYAVAFTVKMSKRGDHAMDGYFDFVVPPLEGLWWQENEEAVDLTDKAAFQWIAMIRLPDFVTEAEFRWAVEQAAEKKKIDGGLAELFFAAEGQCVQMLHVGPFDTEGASIESMRQYAQAMGYRVDLSSARRHHEIYLSDARKVPPEKWRTVIRLPVAPL